MRIKVSRSPSSWSTALLEVALIVVGILLALGASAWYEDRARAQEELLVLEELRTALQGDREVLSAQLDSFQVADEKIAALRGHLLSGRNYADSLDENFGALYGLRIVGLNSSAYESLKSQGLGLVSNASLRAELTRIYDLRYGVLDEVNATQRSVVLEALRPYFLRHFRDLEFHKSATPIDYSFVASDPEFMNLLDYRAEVMRISEIPFYVQTLPEVESLIERIGREIDNLG
jgi:hypothetical protein